MILPLDRDHEETPGRVSGHEQIVDRLAALQHRVPTAQIEPALELLFPGLGVEAVAAEALFAQERFDLQGEETISVGRFRLRKDTWDHQKAKDYREI